MHLSSRNAGIGRDRRLTATFERAKPRHVAKESRGEVKLRERLVSLVERLLELSAAFPRRPLPPEAGVISWIRHEIVRGDPYSAALALDAVARNSISGAAGDALAATYDPEGH